MKAQPCPPQRDPHRRPSWLRMPAQVSLPLPTSAPLTDTRFTASPAVTVRPMAPLLLRHRRATRERALLALAIAPEGDAVVDVVDLTGAVPVPGGPLQVDDLGQRELGRGGRVLGIHQRHILGAVTTVLVCTNLQSFGVPAARPLSSPESGDSRRPRAWARDAASPRRRREVPAVPRRSTDLGCWLRIAFSLSSPSLRSRSLRRAKPALPHCEGPSRQQDKRGRGAPCRSRPGPAIGRTPANRREEGTTSLHVQLTLHGERQPIARPDLHRARPAKADVSCGRQPADASQRVPDVCQRLPSKRTDLCCSMAAGARSVLDLTVVH